jgi:hypothetical protein
MSVFSFARLWLRRFNRPQKKVPFVRQRLLLELLEQRTVPSQLQSKLPWIVPQLSSNNYIDPQSQSLVTGLYYDLLQREPQQTEVDGWASQLTDGTISVSQAVAGFLNSTEYRYDLIRNDYETYLNRNPDPVGRANWFSDLQSGLNAQQLLAGMTSSQEYFANHGASAAGWLTGLYQDLLGRSPDAAGLQAWEHMLQRGTPRWTVANDFIHSSEAEQVQIAQAYQNLLGRAPDPAGAAAWAAAMGQGLTLEQLNQGIASSQEYFDQQQGTDLPVSGGPVAGPALASAGNSGTTPGTSTSSDPGTGTGNGVTQSPTSGDGSTGSTNPTPLSPAQGSTTGAGAGATGSSNSTPSFPAEGGTSGSAGTTAGQNGSMSGSGSGGVGVLPGSSGGSVGQGGPLPGGGSGSFGGLSGSGPTGGVLPGGSGGSGGSSGSGPTGGILPGGSGGSGGSDGSGPTGGVLPGGSGGSGGSGPTGGVLPGGSGGGSGGSGPTGGILPGGSGTSGSTGSGSDTTGSTGTPVPRTLGANAITVGPNIDINKQSGDQSEESIAVDPTNPNRVFAFSNDEATFFSGSIGMMAAYSTDGGLTWKPRVLGSGSDGLPTAFSDPWTTWDNFGNLFISYLHSPNLNANPIQVDLVVALSTDGGVTFHTVFQRTNIFDHPEITTGVGTVWVTYADNTSTSPIAVDGAPVTGLGQVGAFKHFVVPNSTTENFGDVAVSPQGEVVVTFQSSLSNNTGLDTAFVSTNAKGLNGSFGNPVAVATVLGAFRSIPAQAVRNVGATLSLAYDRSGGPHTGRLYLGYTSAVDTTTDNTNEFVVYSDNNGKTWSKRVKINDDTGTNSQFFLHIAVDQTSGFVGAAWYDCRNSSSNTTVETFASFSNDGGQTWAPNVQVAAGPTDGVAVNSNGDPNQLGDYMGIAFYKNVMHPCWADNSTQLRGNPDRPNLDVATATVTVPGPSGGGGGPVQLPDDRFELNDTSNTATQFGVLTGSQTFANLTINHHPSSGLPDYDWYQWTAGTSGTFTVHIDYQSTTGGDLNMRVYELVNGMLVQLGKSTSLGVTSQQVSVPVTAGEPLLVYIYGFDHADATYTLKDSLA